MNPLSATVPVSLVNSILVGAARSEIERLAGCAGISYELLREPGARLTEEQFAILYRMRAHALDDEMPGIFGRPLRNGTLKYLSLSLLDAPNLEVAMHRFGQFLRLLIDEFSVKTRREGNVCSIELVAKHEGSTSSRLGRELILKLAHGLASWLIGQRIPLLGVDFDFPRPPHAVDYRYLFPGPVRFDCSRTLMRFDVNFLDMVIRRQKSDLRVFLAHAPKDWLFVSSAEPMVCHRVRDYLNAYLPTMPTIEIVARDLHLSVRTLCRRLSAEGTTFQAIKDELRRDLAIHRLTRSADAIAAIAYDIGFDDPSAFHRAFRHWTGSTPQAYRKAGPRTPPLR
ncbi:AraC family transcriptional regulator [Pandoraea sp. NE5]|uniref:AraC family transcriptional regulator n=1 Tax=Pandoraea sp. NE5 TaxID=2904129 RepID=UPI0021C376A1|nr:AraC family transcriptional regulator [Pandoraea sp. NE5]BDD93744.1 AraC family transcriptional regulator [Pandoraea sp. NE5]